ncbi:nucleotidyltransferase family protein [Sphingomonas montanisoli]|uniref:DNA polymerase beta n=1 Tax=Sphingomonas montanisoli TaxID=2606412 RepID=A0A5D9CFQ9_9SPHN|nr:nucleotidyltransferase domain-containing protein [Sphingomonas montanisoli]TZG28981.1 DNA polymerase beta [Sphingomonas montanisoli]
MTRDEALARLRPHERELRSAGVDALYLFGSTGRNEAKATSDIDLLCDLAGIRQLSLLDFIGIKDRLEDYLSAPVDLVERRGLRPRIRDRVVPEMVKVF